MKNLNKKSEDKRNLESLISRISETQILNIHAMSCVRGGDGEANGGGDIIIIPPKPGRP